MPLLPVLHSISTKSDSQSGRMQVTTSRVGGRLPRQVQRVLPVCLAFIFLVLFFSKADSLGSSFSPTDVFKRVFLEPPQEIEEFPKKIWQIWKQDPLNFEDRDLNRARPWTALNPEHRYEVLTDGTGLRYVEENFGPRGVNRPDVVYMYRHLTANIIKADLLRYLVLYVEGGVYADIDVEAIRPVRDFIPEPFVEKSIGLVVSVEIDEPTWANHSILGQKSRSFCQWTIMTKPRHPVMMRLIDNIVDWLNEVSRVQDVPVAEIVLDFDQVITGTGPSAFTTAVIAEMEAQTHKKQEWDQFHAIKEPRQVGDILVLTVEAFAAGQGHSDSGNHDSPAAMVKHHYHASLWPDRHPRYSHPAYGMVEECNWHKDCVDAWDNNTKIYETLNPEAQAALILIKEKADQEKFDLELEENATREREEAERIAAEHEAMCNPPPSPSGENGTMWQTPTGEASSEQSVVAEPEAQAALADVLSEAIADELKKKENDPESEAAAKLAQAAAGSGMTK